jgi:hypothetical protein
MPILEDLETYSNLLLSVNTHKKERPLEPIEVSQLIMNLKSETNESWSEVGTRIGIGTDQINAFRKLSVLPKQVFYAIGWGDTKDEKLAFTTAAIIADLDKESDRLTLCKIALTNRLKKEEATRVVQLKKKNDLKSIEQCVEDVLKLRPIVETGYIIVSSLQTATLEKLGSLADKMNKKLENLIIDLIGKVLKKGSVTNVHLKNRIVLLTVDEEAYDSLHTIQVSKKLLFKELFEYLIGESLKIER